MADLTEDADRRTPATGSRTAPSESWLAVWIALRKAHEGGVGNLNGQWCDSGRQVPGYVADALDALISTGLLLLGEEEPGYCGALPVTVTDAGSARYVALHQMHNSRARVAVGAPRRWAYSPREQRSHLLAQCDLDQSGGLAGVCGRRMFWSAATSAQPIGRPCPTCEALATSPVRVPGGVEFAAVAGDNE
jgi:hypothetical protein